MDSGKRIFLWIVEQSKDHTAASLLIYKHLHSLIDVRIIGKIG